MVVPRVDDELPGIGVVEDMTSYAPDHDYNDRNDKGPCGAENF